MDFYDELKALGERSRQKGPSLLTEEAGVCRFLCLARVYG